MTEFKPIKCVVLPARPPIDKLIAFKRVQLDMGDKFRLCVAFCDVNIPTPKHFDLWNAMCSPFGGEAYLIDVGEKKYHKHAGSAAEVEKMSSETEGGRTWNRLVELANENNRNGLLKQARYSIAKALRDVYHVMASGDASQEVAVDHGMDVVNSFFFQENRRDWNSLFVPGQYEALRKLWDGFDVQENEVLPFTLPLYFRQLFLAGRSESEIMAKVTWWIDKVRLVAERRETARQKAYDVWKFQMANGKTGGLIYVGDCFEAEAATYQWIGSGKLAVGIVRNARGQVHIQSSCRHKGVDFSILSGLAKKEPGQWYYETRFKSGPMLMNGSRQFTGVAPTKYTDEQLICLVRAGVKFAN